MKLTNKFNLPEPFMQALGHDDYHPGEGDYTTTELIRPVRISVYKKRYEDQMEEDISERVWAFAGQTKHIVLERIGKSNPERYVTEKRFYATMPGGKTIGGRIDLYDRETKILYDWKENSVWKFIIGDTKEWEEQGNVNLYLMRANGFEVKGLTNVTWLRDWKKRLARTTSREDYPKCAIHVIPLPMWSAGQQQNYILNRIAIFEAGKNDPPVCSFKERWQRPHEYALMKRGRKSAIRLYANRDEAIAVLKKRDASAKSGEHFYVQERPTEPVRCLDFCSVVQFCDFGRTAIEQWKTNNQ